MKSGLYKLAIASGGKCLFADVSVSITAHSEHHQILNHAGAALADFEAASVGVEMELKKVDTPLIVSVTAIQITLADTTLDAITYAAALAVREALGLEDSEYPKISRNEILLSRDHI